ncbi:MAG: hypothetical protein ACE5HV_08870 [Acidobacteriota bacterium]
MAGEKSRQISVRIPAELDAWLEHKAQRKGRKADVVRTLIENAMADEQQERLRATFNEAARELTEADRQERDLLTGAFAAAVRRQQP